MSRYDPTGLTDRLIDMAIGILTLAIALYLAVRIFALIWMWVAVGMVVIGAGWLAVWLLRQWRLRYFNRW